MLQWINKICKEKNIDNFSVEDANALVTLCNAYVEMYLDVNWHLDRDGNRVVDAPKRT